MAGEEDVEPALSPVPDPQQELGDATGMGTGVLGLTGGRNTPGGVVPVLDADVTGGKAEAEPPTLPVTDPQQRLGDSTGVGLLFLAGGEVTAGEVVGEAVTVGAGVGTEEEPAPDPPELVPAEGLVAGEGRG